MSSIHLSRLALCKNMAAIANTVTVISEVVRQISGDEATSTQINGRHLNGTYREQLVIAEVRRYLDVKE